MEKNVRIAICESSMRDLTSLREKIQRYFAGNAADIGISVTAFPNARAFLSEYRPNAFDILFIDIDFGGGRGLNCARHARGFSPDSLIVLTSDSPDDCFDAFQINALHYLVKPLARLQIKEALDRCLRRLFTPNACTVTVNRRPVSIPLREILYAEAYNKCCHIHTVGGLVVTRMPISELEAQLPSPPFIRCHRCYIINTGRVADIQEDCVMENGDIVLIRQETYRQLEKLCGKRAPAYPRSS